MENDEKEVSQVITAEDIVEVEKPNSNLNGMSKGFGGETSQENK